MAKRLGNKLFCALVLTALALLLHGCSGSEASQGGKTVVKAEIILQAYTDEMGYDHCPVWTAEDVVSLSDEHGMLLSQAKPAMCGMASSMFLFVMDLSYQNGTLTFTHSSSHGDYSAELQYSPKAQTSGLRVTMTCADAPQQDIFFRDGEYIPGISLSLYGNSVSAADLAALRTAGCKWVEVILNPFWRNVTEETGWKNAQQLKSLLDASGLRVWSCHLPYSSALDISLSNASKRYEAIATQKKMIRWAEFFGASRVVLHPSSEPIADSERRQRLVNARESIGLLRAEAADCGTVLCVENLPRTCLGRESSELQFLIGDYPDVMVCFDSNHLLSEEHSHFFSALGPRIATIHASDYDRVDERHWIEGAGCIDWPAFRDGLLDSGYKGIFMHEVRKGDDVSPSAIMNAYKTVVCKK